MSTLLNKFRDLLHKNKGQGDVLPPDTKIPTSKVANNIQLDDASEKLEVKPLRGRVVSRNDHETVLETPLDKTEELLCLSEDDFRKTEGINPYDTDSFQSSGIWDEMKRR